MRASGRRATAAILLVVFGLLTMTACQPPDANPSHVYINTWSGPTKVQNDTGYRAHIDRAEVIRQARTYPSSGNCDGPAQPPEPLTFPVTLIPPQGGSVPLPSFAMGDGTTTVKVYFTLVASRGPDGQPVTGVAQMTWVACAIQ